MRQIRTGPDTSWPDVAGIRAMAKVEFLADLASWDLIAGRKRLERGGTTSR